MHTKQTEFLELPQFHPADHPDFLTDFNEAFRNIDKNAELVDGRIGATRQEIGDVVNQIESVNQSMQQVNTAIQQMRELIQSIPETYATKDEVNTQIASSAATAKAYTDNAKSDTMTELAAAEVRIGNIVTLLESNINGKINDLRGEMTSAFGTADTDLLERAKEYAQGYTNDRISEVNDNIEHEVEQLQTAISAAEEQVTSEAASDATFKVNQLKTTLESSISKNSSDIRGVRATVGELNTSVVNHNNALKALQTEDVSLGDRLEAVEDAVTPLTTPFKRYKLQMFRALGQPKEGLGKMIGTVWIRIWRLNHCSFLSFEKPTYNNDNVSELDCNIANIVTMICEDSSKSIELAHQLGINTQAYNNNTYQWELGTGTRHYGNPVRDGYEPYVLPVRFTVFRDVPTNRFGIKAYLPELKNENDTFSMLLDLDTRTFTMQLSAVGVPASLTDETEVISDAESEELGE